MTKTEVKSFIDYSADELENKINNWLEKNEKIEIVSVSQSQNHENEIVVFLFYRVKTKDN